jgi:hypothetical protein
MSENEILAKIFGEEYKPTEKEVQMGGKDIRLKYCGLCDGFYVECPRCGNNTCNAGAGAEEDGKMCTMSMKAYELQDILNKHEALIQELLANARTEEDRKTHMKNNFRRTNA